MLTKERWGAAKFVQGQMRIFVCNDFEFTPWLQKHQNIRGGCVLHMKHEDFLQVIAPMFPQGTEKPHILAVLKRANILVNAGTMMLFRPATQEEVSVQCLVKESEADYLKPESAKRYAAYRNNHTVKPASFQADLVLEANYVNAVPAGLPPPMPRATIINTSLRRLFREPTPPRTLSPHSARPAPTPSNLPHEEAPVPPSSPRTSLAAAS